MSAFLIEANQSTKHLFMTYRQNLCFSEIVATFIKYVESFRTYQIIKNNTSKKSSN